MVYYTDCGGQFPNLQKRSYCNNVSLGKQIDFYVNITLKKYPDTGVYVSVTYKNGLHFLNYNIKALKLVLFLVISRSLLNILKFYILFISEPQNPGRGNLLERAHGLRY